MRRPHEDLRHLPIVIQYVVDHGFRDTDCPSPRALDHVTILLCKLALPISHASTSDLVANFYAPSHTHLHWTPPQNPNNNPNLLRLLSHHLIHFFIPFHPPKPFLNRDFFFLSFFIEPPPSTPRSEKKKRNKITQAVIFSSIHSSPPSVYSHLILSLSPSSYLHRVFADLHRSSNFTIIEEASIAPKTNISPNKVKEAGDSDLNPDLT